MARTSPSALIRSDIPKRSIRWIVLLAVSLLWHLLILNWAGGYLPLPSWRSEQTAVIMTELRPLPASAEPPTPAPAPALARAPKRKPALAAPETTNTIAMPVIEGPPDTEVVPLPDLASQADPQPQFSEPPPQPEEPAAGNTKFSPPPSAELKYDVQALRDGKQWFGSGVFQWNTAGDRYSITGEASITILFKITALNFRSEGAIKPFGIAPVLYSEKPWRKSATNTHFQHDKQMISFSASQAVYPYKGGEQDRASIMWQLAGIGRGDPDRYVPGTTFDIMVAGARDAHIWRIEVVGQEDIETPYGKMSAWHVVRAPRPESHDQKIDIWLAPQHEWYPVKVRFTYANGDFFDMLLTALTRPATTTS